MSDSTREDRETRRARREAESKALDEKLEQERLAREDERRQRRAEMGLVIEPQKKAVVNDSELEDMLLEAEAIAQLELEQEAEREMEKMLKEMNLETETSTVSSSVGLEKKKVIPKGQILIECDKCGEKNLSNDRFCGKCGVPVRLAVNTVQPEVKPKPVVNTTTKNTPITHNGPIVKRSDPTPQVEKGSIYAEQESIVDKKNERKAWLESLMTGGVEAKRKEEQAQRTLEINKQQAKEDQIKRQERELANLEKELADLDDAKWAEEMMKDMYLCECGTQNIEGDKFCGKCGKKV